MAGLGRGYDELEAGFLGLFNRPAVVSVVLTRDGVREIFHLTKHRLGSIRRTTNMLMNPIYQGQGLIVTLLSNWPASENRNLSEPGEVFWCNLPD